MKTCCFAKTFAIAPGRRRARRAGSSCIVLARTESPINSLAFIRAEILDFGFLASFGFRHSSFVIYVLLLLAGALSAQSQSLTVLHAFSPVHGDPTLGLTSTNSDGRQPNGGLVFSNGTLYGTASSGGKKGGGTVFSIATNGTNFKVLYTFSADPFSAGNTDGSLPNGTMVMAGGRLYGTTQNGGSTNDNGGVFALPVTGTNSTNAALYAFGARFANKAGILTNLDGVTPSAGLALGGARLYGTTSAGGFGGSGTVFAINTNGIGFTNFYNFTVSSSNSFGVYTNKDGASPVAELLLSGGTLYGTTFSGGLGGQGTLFAISTNGAGFTNLHTFFGIEAAPTAGLVLSSNTLYGISGTNIFAINTNGTGFRVIYQFTNNISSSDSLSLVGGTLFCAVPDTGAYQDGMAFSITTNGGAFTAFHDFTPSSYNTSISAYTNLDGFSPNGGVVWTNGSLYGTTSVGGPGGSGVIFSVARIFSLTPRVSGGNFVFSFPTDPAHTYTVQQNTNLSTTNWTVFTNFAGDGSITQIFVPISIAPQSVFRVRAL